MSRSLKIEAWRVLWADECRDIPWAVVRTGIQPVGQHASGEPVTYFGEVCDGRTAIGANAPSVGVFCFAHDLHLASASLPLHRLTTSEIWTASALGVMLDWLKSRPYLGRKRRRYLLRTSFNIIYKSRVEQLPAKE